MCNNQELFSHFQARRIPMNVAPGDGRNLQATGHGNVVLTISLSQRKVKKSTLYDVLVSDLVYNLVSVTSTSKKGKETKFSEMTCEI